MSWPKGKKRPAELVEKTAAAVRGTKWSAERKAKMCLIMTGKKASPETREKQRISHLGKNNRQGYVQPEETKRKISEKLKGRKLSEETREKMRNKTFSEESHENYRNRYFPDETKEKLSKAMLGEKNHQWKGGTSPLVKLIRRCAKYGNWRFDVFKRDNFSCVSCGNKKSKFEADHYPVPFAAILHENNIRTLSEAFECSDFWNVNNGRTLCISCHNKTRGRKTS